MYAPVETEQLEELPDADLLHRFQQGDDEALEVLLRRYADELYRFCCHLVPNRQDAEDICQESLTRAIDRVGSLERGCAFRGWLFRIARNLSVDSFRQRRRTCTLLDEEVTPQPLRVEGPQESVEVGEEHQTVAQALGRLAKSHQRVLLLREVEGLSYAAIARRLQVSHSAVETLLFRARRRLREEYVKSEFPASGPTMKFMHCSQSAAASRTRNSLKTTPDGSTVEPGFGPGRAAALFPGGAETNARPSVAYCHAVVDQRTVLPAPSRHT